MLGDNSEAKVWGWKEGSRTHQSFIYSIYSRALGAVPGCLLAAGGGLT